LRLMMYLCYPMLLGFKVLAAPRGSIFIVTSNTFYAVTIATCCAIFKKGRIINLIYDLFPDALEVAGKIRPDSVLSKGFGFISRINGKFTECTIYLGEFLREHAEMRWASAGSSRSIPISADAELFTENEKYKGGVIRIHYGGQIGYMHDAEVLISSVLAACREPVLSKRFQFDFRVSGAQAKKIETAFANQTISVRPPVSSQQWREELRLYHIGLVTLSPGGATVCLPSKSYAMMAGGLPIIAICPLWSDLAHTILSANAGWVINNSPFTVSQELRTGNYQEHYQQKVPTGVVQDEFLKLLGHLENHPEEILEKRNGALNAMKNQYGTEQLSLMWKSILG
ncbi:MAG: hypothetical protein K8I82_11745, partial [Anaerolineae bacterium]|nr:hypothetical protein [Anaerolineae bacterium]